MADLIDGKLLTHSPGRLWMRQGTMLHPIRLLSFSSNRSLELRGSFNTQLGSKLSLRQRDPVKPVVECVMGGAESSDVLTDKMGSLSERQKKLAVFVSGGGSNFRAIHDATVKGIVNGEVTVLVTDKAGCGGAEYAREKGIPVILFPKSMKMTDGLSSFELVTSLREHGIDFLLLAGFLKLIPVELVRAYPRSILNIHPSLLPSFGGKGYYGLKVHKAVIASGARYSGPTIHYVDEHYDTGRILAQSVVPVFANDNAEELAARVLHEEHKLYVEVVAALCEDRIVWRADGVPLIQSREDPTDYR